LDGDQSQFRRRISGKIGKLAGGASEKESLTTSPDRRRTEFVLNMLMFIFQMLSFEMKPA
jgi:hypothetical protein